MWLLLQDSDKNRAAPTQQPSSALRAHGCGHAAARHRPALEQQLYYASIAHG